MTDKMKTTFDAWEAELAAEAAKRTIQKDIEAVLNAAQDLSEVQKEMTSLLNDIPGWAAIEEKGADFDTEPFLSGYLDTDREQLRIGSQSEPVRCGILAVNENGDFVWYPHAHSGVDMAPFGFIKSNTRIATDICRCLKEHFFALMATAKNIDETKTLLDLLRPLAKRI